MPLAIAAANVFLSEFRRCFPLKPRANIFLNELRRRFPLKPRANVFLNELRRRFPLKPRANVFLNGFCRRFPLKPTANVFRVILPRLSSCDDEHRMRLRRTFRWPHDSVEEFP